MDAEVYFALAIDAAAAGDTDTLAALADMARDTAFPRAGGYGDPASTVTEDARARVYGYAQEYRAAKLGEACVPNKAGQGHHDDKTGHPCTPGGGAGGADKPAGDKPAGVKYKVRAGTPPKVVDRLRKVVADLSAAKGLSAEQKTAYFDHAQEILGKLTPKALERFSANTDGVSYCPDLATVKETVQQALPDQAGALEGLEIAGCYLSYNTTGRLVLDGHPGEATAAVMGTESALAVHAHEYTHAIDGPKFELSKSPGWGDAWKQEIKAGKLSKYATTDPTEGFAEFGRLLLGGEHDLEEVKYRYPKCYYFWHKQGLAEAVASSDGPTLREDTAGQSLPELFGRKVVLSPNGTHADVTGYPRATEACVPNKGGRGYHDDQTGYPCNAGGKDDGPGDAQGKRSVRADLAKVDPALASDPAKWEQVKGTAKRIGRRVLTAARELSRIAVNLAPDILDTAEDTFKITFARDTDVLRQHTGVGAGPAMNIASILLSHAVVWAKQKLRQRGQQRQEAQAPEPDMNAVARVLAELFAGVCEDAGVKVDPPSPETILHALKKQNENRQDS